MAEVTEVNDIHTLGGYRMAWNALFAQTPNATFFQTFDWLSIYWQHFGEGMKLRVLVVRAGGEVIGIVPLCVKKQNHKIGSVRTLCYPLDGWGNVFGPVGPNPAATLSLAMKHIARSRRDWDRIELDWVAHETADRGRTARAMELAGLRPTIEPGDATSLIDLPDDFEGFLSGLKGKVRHELRRHIRRVGEAEHARYLRRRPAPASQGDGAAHWGLFEHCLTIARASWQSGSIDGNTLCHPEYQEFYRDTHAAAARLGMVEINLLLVGDRPVAFNYNYVCRGHVTGLRMGFDPEHAPKGAGLALIGMILRDSCDRGDRLIDLGVGGQDFKRRMQTRQLPTHKVVHTPLSSWRSQAVRLGHWIRRENRPTKTA